MTQAPEVPLSMQRDGLDPSAELNRVREEDGVTQITLGSFGMYGKAWLITRYADVRAGLADHGRFSNNPANAAEPQLPPGLTEEEVAKSRHGHLLLLDPPDHTQLRRLLMPEFTMRRMRRLEDRITEIVDDHLDQLERLGPGADLVANFALPIPSLVICELLGVPYADRAEFQSRSSRQLDISLPVQERIELGRESREYMHSLVLRARQNPGEDMLGMLIREHGDKVDDDMLTNIAGLLLIAGHETTANMLGAGTFALLTHPEQLAWWREDLTGRAETAVEELMRYLTVVSAGVARIATEDIELHGQRIRKGELVVFVLSAANRDPGLVEQPEQMRLARPSHPHLAFGHGAHHCLGAPLARAEMRTAFPALLRRFPKLALAVPPEQVPFKPYHAVYGVAELPVTW